MRVSRRPGAASAASQASWRQLSAACCKLARSRQPMMRTRASSGRLRRCSRGSAGPRGAGGLATCLGRPRNTRGREKASPAGEESAGAAAARGRPALLLRQGSSAENRVAAAAWSLRSCCRSQGRCPESTLRRVMGREGGVGFTSFCARGLLLGTILVDALLLRELTPLRAARPGGGRPPSRAAL